jgi:hypothetical protein
MPHPYPPMDPDDEESFIESVTEDLLELGESWDEDGAREEAKSQWAAEMKYRADYDPTPYCSACRARSKEFCKCPPIADNE